MAQYQKFYIPLDNHAVEKIKYYINRYKCDLLLNKEYDFSPNQKNFGDLTLKNAERLDENRSNVVIKFVINDFTKFKDDRKFHFSTDWCIIKNVPWRIQAGIKETKNFDNGLGFYVGSDFSNAEFDCTITYKVVQNNKINKSKLCLSKTSKYVFTDSLNYWGYPEFILLRNIMDISNGFYDQVNDSITLEAHIAVN